MITGRFGNTTGRPYIEARVWLLDRYSDVSFVVDTGADRSILSPGDVERFGIDPELLGPRRLDVGGVSKASVLCAETDALLAFSDSECLWVYGVNLAIGFADQMSRRLPSLLGRDVLNRWGMTCDYKENRLDFMPHDADWAYPLPNPI